MIDILLNQIKSSVKFGNVIKNSDGSISMILDEKDIKNMVMSGILRAKTNIPVPMEMLKNLLSVKIDKGKIEIKVKVI